MSALHDMMFSQPFWSPQVSVLFNASRAYALHWNLCKWLPMLQTKMQCCQCAAWPGCVPTSASCSLICAWLRFDFRLLDAMDHDCTGQAGVVEFMTLAPVIRDSIRIQIATSVELACSHWII